MPACPMLQMGRPVSRVPTCIIAGFKPTISSVSVLTGVNPLSMTNMLLSASPLANAVPLASGVTCITETNRWHCPIRELQYLNVVICTITTRNCVRYCDGTISVPNDIVVREITPELGRVVHLHQSACRHHRPDQDVKCRHRPGRVTSTTN